MAKHPLTREQKELLGLYLEEIAATGLLEKNLDAYLYLRGLAHLLIQDQTLESYVKYRKGYSKYLHKMAKFELAKGSKFRNLLNTYNLICANLGSKKAIPSYFEDCLRKTAQEVTV